MSRGDKGPRGLGAWPRAHGILPVTLNAGAGLCGAGRDAQSLGSVPKGPSAPIGQFPVRGPRDPAPPQRELNTVIPQGLTGSLGSLRGSPLQAWRRRSNWLKVSPGGPWGGRSHV